METIQPPRVNLIRYEVPLTWLIGGCGCIASALFYAGWQAADLKIQLESAVRLGKEVMQKQDAMSKDLMELKVKDQLFDAKISQIEQRLNKVDK
jgi:pyridoxal/pyridoxine/pyridoxamine kinase